jgi:hypothetical protein
MKIEIRSSSHIPPDSNQLKSRPETNLCRGKEMQGAADGEKACLDAKPASSSEDAHHESHRARSCCTPNRAAETKACSRSAERAGNQNEPRTKKTEAATESRQRRKMKNEHLAGQTPDHWWETDQTTVRSWRGKTSWLHTFALGAGKARTKGKRI